MAAALIAGAVACNQKELLPEAPEESCGTVQLSAEAISPEDGSKVSFGELVDGQSRKYYPVYWDEDEMANVSEFYDKVRSQDKSSTCFSRSQDKTRGTFTFILDEKTSGEIYDYIVISPQSAARTTGTAAAKKNRASFALAPTVPQKPKVDGPDPAACIMMAQDLGHTSQPASLSLHFEHQLAFAKMTITAFPTLDQGETVKQIKISAPEGKHLSGRLWYDYSTGEYTEYEGSMEDYILVDPENVIPAELTLWFAVMPVRLSMGETLVLRAETSSGRILSTKVVLGKELPLERGKVSVFTVNWQKFQDKVLSFDFSSWPSGWPDNLANGTEYKYGDYSFVHYGYTNGSPSTNRCTHKRTTPDFMVLNGLGFLSLPVIENHKLVKAVVTHGAAKANTRCGGIVYGIRELPENVEFVTADAKSTSLWNVTPGTYVELPLLTSLPGHRYYLCCSAAGLGISRLELHYEYDPGADIRHESDAITVGTLNVWQPSARTSKKESGEAAPEREWEYARYNVRDIIKDSGFDILAVQEVTQRVRNDLKTDLASTGKYEYEYFLHKPSVPASSSSVGIIYDKSRFSISNKHHFWLSDTPDTAESQYAEESSVRSVGCAEMTDAKTGRKYFVMVAHASLDDGCNEKDGNLLVERIKQYNTANLPCIVMGDMNANWNMPLYRTLSSWCDDSRYKVELSEQEFPLPGTYNGPGGDADNFGKRQQRIDFIFTRGCNVYSYRVNRDKYKAGSTYQYPSDHCPVMIQCY